LLHYNLTYRPEPFHPLPSELLLAPKRGNFGAKNNNFKKMNIS